MMKLTQLLCLILVICLAGSMLSGCGSQAAPSATPEPSAEPEPAAPSEETPATDPKPAQSPAASPVSVTATEPPVQTEEPAQTQEPAPSSVSVQLSGKAVSYNGGKGFTDFDSTLIAFLEENGYQEKSFLVSPLSYRCALALAVSGAGGETKQKLLEAMDFDSEEEVIAWYGGLLKAVEDFQAGLGREKEYQNMYPDDFAQGASAPDRAFSIANSIWHNADGIGSFREEYKQKAQDIFGAKADNLPAAELTGAINNWVNEETHGMIPSIVGDLTDTEAVLVNALYLRTSWVNTFEKTNTKPGDFHALNGSTVKMDFMHQQEDYLYYEDEGTQLLVLPMAGNMRSAFVLGDKENINDKLSAAKREDVIVTLPKFELETALDNSELTNYLDAMGAGLALGGDADFSGMSGQPWSIGDIIQKSKVKMDEEGIEAAAATAIMMDEASAMENPPPPKEFTADRPFSFYLYSTCGQTPELLFYGQFTG